MLADANGSTEPVSTSGLSLELHASTAESNAIDQFRHVGANELFSGTTPRGDKRFAF
jgi:hypothetical protein